MIRHARHRAAAHAAAGIAVLVLLPVSSAMAQLPPPTPTPTIGADIDCSVHAGRDSIDVECSGPRPAEGATPLAANSRVLAQVFCVGCPSTVDASSVPSALPHASDAPVAADVAEELVVAKLVDVDANGHLDFEALVPFCGVKALRVLATGVSEAGDAVAITDAIDDADDLMCASDALSSANVDWLPWFALGLLLLTASAWIASVRDQHEIAPT